MLYVASKLFGYLIKPFNLILLFLLVSLIVKNSVWKRRLRWSALGFFMVFSNGIVFNECMLLWEVPAVSLDAVEEKYDLAIVLGGTVDIDREPADRLFFQKSGTERITHAVDVYHAGIVEKIMYVGGNPAILGDPAENNEAVVQFYQMCGVDPADIMSENESRNTHENALNAKKMLGKNAENTKVVLITSAYHMRRAVACFKKEGFEVIPFSADFYSTKPEDRFTIFGLFPSPVVLSNWNLLIKEWVGYVAYALLGYL
jgi:uncharacterized SAM-binding protein YcdF (DUF218 family)